METLGVLHITSYHLQTEVTLHLSFQFKCLLIFFPYLNVLSKISYYGEYKWWEHTHLPCLWSQRKSFQFFTNDMLALGFSGMIFTMFWYFLSIASLLSIVLFFLIINNFELCQILLRIYCNYNVILLLHPVNVTCNLD